MGHLSAGMGDITSIISGGCRGAHEGEEIEMQCGDCLGRGDCELQPVAEAMSVIQKQDTYSDAYRLACLARWLLAKTLPDRRATLERMEKRHGAQFIETLKSAMTEEWEKRHD